MQKCQLILQNIYFVTHNGKIKPEWSPLVEKLYEQVRESKWMIYNIYDSNKVI